MTWRLPIFFAFCLYVVALTYRLSDHPIRATAFSDTLVIPANSTDGGSGITAVANAAAEVHDNKVLANQYPTINAAVAALRGGCGLVEIPAGTYTISRTLSLSGCVSIRGYGAAATKINCSMSGSDCIQDYDSTFSADIRSASRIGHSLSGFTLNSTGSPTVLIHNGDELNTSLRDITLFCNGSGKGIWHDNRLVPSAWYERNLELNVSINGCSIGEEFTGAAGLQNSFSYNQWLDVDWYVAAGQSALQVDNNSYLNHNSIIASFNGGDGTRKVFLHVANGGQVKSTDFDVRGEDDNPAPDMVPIEADAGSSLQGVGELSCYNCAPSTGSWSWALPEADSSPTVTLNPHVQQATATKNYGGPLFVISGSAWSGSAAIYPNATFQYGLSAGTAPFSYLKFVVPNLGKGSSFAVDASSLQFIVNHSTGYAFSFVPTGTFSEYPKITIPDPGTSANMQLAFPGITGSIGGTALKAGQCASGTASIKGATAGMTGAAAASDGSYQANFLIHAQGTSPGRATVFVCAITPGTPAAKTYNVRLFN